MSLMQFLKLPGSPENHVITYVPAKTPSLFFILIADPTVRPLHFATSVHLPVRPSPPLTGVTATTSQFPACLQSGKSVGVRCPKHDSRCGVPFLENLQCLPIALHVKADLLTMGRPTHSPHPAFSLSSLILSILQTCHFVQTP